MPRTHRSTNHSTAAHAAGVAERRRGFSDRLVANRHMQGVHLPMPVKASDSPKRAPHGFRGPDQRAESRVCQSIDPVVCKPHRSRHAPAAPEPPGILIEQACSRHLQFDGTVPSLRCRKAPGTPCSLTELQKSLGGHFIGGMGRRWYEFKSGLCKMGIGRDLDPCKYGRQPQRGCSLETSVGSRANPAGSLTRACKCDPRAFRESKCRRLPALKRKALAAGAHILFLDENCVRADAQMGREGGPKGSELGVERDGRRPSVNAIGMVSARGAFCWEVFRGTFNSARFDGFLERFMKRRKGPVVIVLDNHLAHVSTAVVRLAERSEGRLRLEYLPAYAQELNPQEQAWRYAKRTGTSRNPLREGESISERAERDLEAMQKKPRLIRSFFDQPDTVYVHEAA